MSTVPIFRCASCGEFIAADTRTCRFCNSPVDFNQAMQSAGFEQQKNALLNRASYLRILGTTMIPVAFVGFLVGLARLGVLIGGLATPLIAMLTYFELGKLPMDPDVADGRKKCLVAIVGSVIAWLISAASFLLVMLARFGGNS